jgi:DNA-directed RNA polymerase specialized sigma24 family protein
MASAALLEQARQEAWSDEQVVSRVRAGETALYELLMRRYNQRLYHLARAILRNDAEVEDVMQDAYVNAYQHLAEFEGRAKFSTWLARIAVHEALARSRRGSRFQSLDNSGESKGGLWDHSHPVAAILKKRLTIENLAACWKGRFWNCQKITVRRLYCVMLKE